MSHPWAHVNLVNVLDQWVTIYLMGEAKRHEAQTTTGNKDTLMIFHNAYSMFCLLKDFYNFILLLYDNKVNNNNTFGYIS